MVYYIFVIYFCILVRVLNFIFVFLVMLVRLVENSSLLSKVIPSTFYFWLFLVVTLFDTSSIWCRGLLRQHGPCYKTKKQPSFTNTDFQNSRLNIWLSLKPLKARLSVSKARPRVLKQRFGRVFWSTDTLKIFENLFSKKQRPYIW